MLNSIFHAGTFFNRSSIDCYGGSFAVVLAVLPLLVSVVIMSV